MLRSNLSSRRRQKARPNPEMLETRSLMTGGAGNTFALIPGTIATPGGSTDISFTISQPPFTLPRGSMALGIDVVPQPGSAVQPLIKKVTDAHGNLDAQAFHSIYNPHLLHAAVARGVGTRAVLAPVTLFPGQPDKPVTYSVTITGESNTMGGFLVGFYLPGDADGNGVVNQADIQAVRADFGAKAGDSRYNFDADANRDGRIGFIDLAYAQQNLGVATTVTPLVSANLDPASDVGAADRITNIRNVHFSGQGTPGASVAFAEVNQKSAPVNTTVDPQGNYSVNVGLGDGSNTFRVTSVDSFGQTITGQISPVIFTASPPPAPRPLSTFSAHA